MNFKILMSAIFAGLIATKISASELVSTSDSSVVSCEKFSLEDSSKIISFFGESAVSPQNLQPVKGELPEKSDDSYDRLKSAQILQKLGEQYKLQAAESCLSIAIDPRVNLGDTDKYKPTQASSSIAIANGLTPLHIAAQNGHEEVVKALLKVECINFKQ